ncbi:lipase family protein [Methylocystis parvus]|uniref:Lipase family protein n=1 Tax=Methylocystis parvus TaxID=134 RepID=A0A6B8M497_9HYPH|nr:lipase family protein [Methylocystis parvus]QGM98734.1 lipase family protein [Methylocystis parvus]WBK00916.1 lipase family protein [Methylocystis parvus OBBP]
MSISTSADTIAELTTRLPSAISLQDIAVRLANGVCAAYAAYNNGSNLTPSLNGYKNLNLIYAFEADPNGNPFGAAEAKASAVSGTKQRTLSRVESEPAAYARGPNGAAPACVGPTPIGTPRPGSQLFGFTATANDNSHNILVLRGTVTLEEAGYDLLGWGDNTPCYLPSQTGTQIFGMVNSYLYAFYVNDDGGLVTSLAASCLNAIQNTSAQAPNAPWYMGAHSLGGAMLSLAALDAVVSGVLNEPPLVVTFGSLHVGDAAFAQAYKAKIPASLRVANLCDFVPSMVSLEPVTLADPYVHVGVEATFVWQTWDDWGNHSHANIYMPMVQNYWSVIHFGPRAYPQ